MKHTYKVENSSTISNLEYDFDHENLVVEFKSGARYRYLDVPATAAKEFFLSESKGRHFAANIKDVFETEKIGAAGHEFCNTSDWPFPQD